MIRSKGTLVVMAVVGLMAALYGLNYLRSTPSGASANQTSKVSQPYSAETEMPPLPVSSVGPNAPTPVTVRCGDTVVTVQAGDSNAVKVDCNQVARSVQPVVVQTDEEVVARPVVHRTVRRRVQPRTVTYYDDEREYPRQYRNRKRSWQKEALIIGGSAGAGTAIGAVAGGKKGAGIGALSGGVAGLVYDLATRNK